MLRGRLRPLIRSHVVSHHPRLVSTTIHSPTSQEITLQGSAPIHRSYIFLHSTIRPTDLPAKYSTPIQRALQLRVLKWGGVVNFSWFPSPTTPSTSNIRENIQSATAFSNPAGRLEIPEVTLENIDDIDALLQEHCLKLGRSPHSPLPSPSHSPPLPLELSSATNAPELIDFYVCTHMARDCRCGSLGTQVAEALRAEVDQRRGMKHESDHMQGLLSSIRVGEVAHVGGHKYAANVLVYPHGEWFGLITPEDVPRVLDAVLARRPAPISRDVLPLLPKNWRGRMGLSKTEQLELYDRGVGTNS